MPFNNETSFHYVVLTGQPKLVGQNRRAYGATVHYLSSLPCIECLHDKLLAPIQALAFSKFRSKWRYGSVSKPVSEEDKDREQDISYSIKCHYRMKDFDPSRLDIDMSDVLNFVEMSARGLFSYVYKLQRLMSLGKIQKMADLIRWSYPDVPINDGKLINEADHLYSVKHTGEPFKKCHSMLNDEWIFDDF